MKNGEMHESDLAKAWLAGHAELARLRERCGTLEERMRITSAKLRRWSIRDGSCRMDEFADELDAALADAANDAGEAVTEGDWQREWF